MYGYEGNDLLIGGTGNDTYVYHYGQDGLDTITDVADVEDPADVDVLAIWNAMPGYTAEFTLEGSSDLFIQIGDDPGQGVLVKDFFTADQGGLNADVEEIVIYADSGATVLGVISSQEVYDQLFS